MQEQVRIKQRQRGLTPAQWVETLRALWTAGGDRCQDLQTLRDFLEAFHVEDLPLLHAGEKTSVPEESAPLAGVGAATRRVLAAVQQSAPQPPPRWMWMRPFWKPTSARQR